MIIISSKGDYGLQIMLHLAKNSDAGYISLQDIAKAEGLPPQYLAQIVLPLKKDGLIKSKEGKGGGHCLAKKSNKISVLEILESLEGPICFVKCFDNEKNSCTQSGYCDNCKVRGHFSMFIDDIRSYFAGISLADLEDR